MLLFSVSPQILTYLTNYSFLLAAGITAAILFSLNRVCILRRENSTQLAIYFYPLLVGVTVFINGGWLEGGRQCNTQGI